MQKFLQKHKQKIVVISWITIAKIVITLIIILGAAYFMEPKPANDLTITVVGNADISTPADFNVTRYMGLWHEVARYNQTFETDCECVTANYTFFTAYVAVQNSCVKNNQLSVANAKAYTTNVPGVLNVQFVPLINGDYRVVYVDANYENAIVSNQAQTSLWFLSRNPSTESLNNLLTIAKSKHFDTTKLYFTKGCN